MSLHFITSEFHFQTVVGYMEAVFLCSLLQLIMNHAAVMGKMREVHSCFNARWQVSQLQNIAGIRSQAAVPIYRVSIPYLTPR